MGWKDILVFADGTSSGVSRVRMAAELAAAQGAYLTVCIPVAVPSLGPYADAAITAEVYQDMLQEERAKADAIAAIVRAETSFFADHVTVESPETLSFDLPALAGDLGRTSDLIVLGKPVPSESSRLKNAILQDALFRSGRPILMLPAWTEPRPFGRRVLVGWKDVREAARAVHDALPLLRQADAVRLFVGEDVSRNAEEHAAQIMRLSLHLKRHGVRLAAEDQAPAVRDIGVIEEAKLWGADLAVMGGYGHARLQELVFGGATRQAIHESPIAVLMSH